MTYTTEVNIHLPRLKVIEQFDSTENLHKWQLGLKSFEAINGEPGQEGSSSKMVYEGRKGDLEMTEVITRRNFPEEFHCTYKARGVYNEIYNYFEDDGDKTQWRTVSVFKFRGLMAFMAPFMKAAFIKNTLLNMERFKEFAEK
jgi:hypothetical protein